MSQRISTNSLRLKTRLSWNNTIMLQSFKNYTNYSINSNNTINIICIILNKLGFFINEPTIINDSKKLRFYSKIINEKNIYNFLDTKNLALVSKIYRLPISYLNQHIWHLQHCFFNNNRLLLNLSIYDTINIIQNKFMLISPILINAYINYQLQTPKQYKNKSWQKSYYLGLVEIARFFLNRFKHNITGIKIVCSGKWKKTNSGRKQKFLIKFGQIRTNVTKTVIFTNELYNKTKFGFFAIKIWISHKL